MTHKLVIYRQATLLIIVVIIIKILISKGLELIKLFSLPDDENYLLHEKKVEKYSCGICLNSYEKEEEKCIIF